MGRTWLAVYHTEENRMVRLATPEIPNVIPHIKGDAETVMGISTLPYLIRN